MIRKIGYACINQTLSSENEFGKVSKNDRVFTNRTLRLNNFSLEAVSKLILNNCKDLFKILVWNKAHGISFFRISSDIFPFKDHPDFQYDLSELPDFNSIIKILSDCGLYALENNIRLSMHPGPYNCLGSPNEQVVHKTLLSLEMHREIGELLGQEDFVINIHVGGTYGGDFLNTSNRFCDNFYKLSKSTQKWLIIENDDKQSMWSVSKLYNLIHKRIDIPIILDVHHWQFCNEESIQDAFSMAYGTWKNMFPKIHYSESAIGKRPQAHSDYICGELPLFEGDYDVMVEAKMKEKAIMPLLL